ncbi:unnamed protein product, partial [Urochloa humidicola]
SSSSSGQNPCETEPSSPAKSAISSPPKTNRQRRDLLQANSFVLDPSSLPAMAYMAGD